MSYPFELQSASSLTPPLLGKKSVTYAPLRTLKFEPGRSLTVATGIRIRRCSHGWIKIVPCDKYEEKLSFDANLYQNSNHTPIVIKVTNLTDHFIRLDPSNHLFKFTFINANGTTDESEDEEDIAENGEDCAEALSTGPSAEKPVEEKPVEEKPVVEEPVAEEPVEEEPVEEKPVIEEPVIEEPVIEEPVIEEPVEEKPVEEKPVEEKLVEEKPVEEKLVEEKPVEEKLVVAEEKPEPKKASTKAGVKKSTKAKKGKRVSI